MICQRPTTIVGSDQPVPGTNKYRGKTHGKFKRIGQTHRPERTYETRTGSHCPAVARLLARHDRLYVVDCGDGSGPNESRWTPGANVGDTVGFPGHCYIIRRGQGWFLWDTGIDDAVAKLPNHERVFHEWDPALADLEQTNNARDLARRDTR